MDRNEVFPRRPYPAREQAPTPNDNIGEFAKTTSAIVIVRERAELPLMVCNAVYTLTEPANVAASVEQMAAAIQRPMCPTIG